MALIVNKSRIALTQIKEVKHELIIPHRVIYIGYSTQSLRTGELIYEIHDALSGIMTSAGRLTIFGTRHLTPFVRYKGNTFIVLVAAAGRKEVELHDFEHNIRSQLIKSIEFKEYQWKATREKYGMMYHNDTITIVQMTETDNLNILVRNYTSEKAELTYRVISFESMPQLYFHAGCTYLFSKLELTLLSRRLQPQFYELANRQQLKIANVNDLIILTYGDEHEYFSMTPDGRTFELGCEITALAVRDNYVYTIVSAENTKKLKILQFNHSEAKYETVAETAIPIQCQNKIVVGDWIKLSLQGNTEDKREILVVSWDAHKLQQVGKNNNSQQADTPKNTGANIQ